MPYHYLDDLTSADVAFAVQAATVEELFVLACDAATNTMVSDLNTIAPAEYKQIDIDAESVEMLLFRFLNDCIYYKDAEQLFLRVHTIAILQADSSAKPDSVQVKRMQASLYGEKIDPAKHNLLVDVKAATLHKFFVNQTESGWQAQVILDV